MKKEVRGREGEGEVCGYALLSLVRDEGDASFLSLLLGMEPTDRPTHTQSTHSGAAGARWAHAVCVSLSRSPNGGGRGREGAGPGRPLPSLSQPLPSRPSSLALSHVVQTPPASHKPPPAAHPPSPWCRRRFEEKKTSGQGPPQTGPALPSRFDYDEKANHGRAVLGSHLPAALGRPRFVPKQNCAVPKPPGARLFGKKGEKSHSLASVAWAPPRPVAV